MVVGERVGLARLRVGDLDAVRTRVDRGDLGVDAHLEVQRSFESLRGVEEEPGGVFDLAANVVREPAVREGHVLAALQHDDLGTLIAPAQARRRAHTTRDSSDDYNSHVRLTFWLGGMSSLPPPRIPRGVLGNKIPTHTADSTAFERLPHAHRLARARSTATSRF